MNEAARLRSELDGLRRDKDQVGLFINLLHPPPTPCPENFNAESTDAKIQKSHYVNEAARLRSELDGQMKPSDQDLHCFYSEAIPKMRLHYVPILAL